MMRKGSCGLLACMVFGALPFFTIGIAADDVDATLVIHRTPIEGYNELAKALSKGDVRPEDKARAVERLAELTKDLPSHPNIKPVDLYNPILGVLSDPRNKEQKTLKKTAAHSLVSFRRLEGSTNLIEPLGKILHDSNEDLEVRRAAAVALGRFDKDTAAATDQLIRALDNELQTGPKGDNISYVKLLIDSIGMLQDKRSFVPLMRVINSGFPTSTKRSAQRALENIKWQ